MTNKTKPTPGCCCAETVRIEGACSLHAAAPDLLAACHDARARLQMCIKFAPEFATGDIRAHMAALDAAIVKAQGGKS